MKFGRWRGLLLALFIALHSLPGLAEKNRQVLAPGYGLLQFTPPVAGTYSLPPLGAAAGGTVINSRGETLSLQDLTGDKLVLMGFIYTHCGDINGCPLASYVMNKVQTRLTTDEQLASQVRLISLSFDPELDTPEALA